MSLFRRKPERPPAEEREAEVAALRERVARLEADLELLRQKNAELAKEASPTPKENAVLRYELFKCQTDRQVLEFHLSGLRAELRGTLALLRRLAPGEPPRRASPRGPFGAPGGGAQAGGAGGGLPASSPPWSAFWTRNWTGQSGPGRASSSSPNLWNPYGKPWPRPWPPGEGRVPESALIFSSGKGVRVGMRWCRWR